MKWLCLATYPFHRYHNMQVSPYRGSASCSIPLSGEMSIHLHLAFATLWHLDILKSDVLLSIEPDRLHHLDRCNDCNSWYQLKRQQASTKRSTGCEEKICIHSAMYRRWIATLHKQGISSWVCKATHVILPWGCVNPTAGYDS